MTKKEKKEKTPNGVPRIISKKIITEGKLEEEIEGEEKTQELEEISEEMFEEKHVGAFVNSNNPTLNMINGTQEHITNLEQELASAPRIESKEESDFQGYDVSKKDEEEKHYQTRDPIMGTQVERINEQKIGKNLQPELKNVDIMDQTLVEMRKTQKNIEQNYIVESPKKLKEKSPQDFLQPQEQEFKKIQKYKVN